MNGNGDAAIDTNTAANPEASGFDAARLERVTALIEQGRSEGMYPAAVCILLRSGQIGYQYATGYAQPNANPPIAATLDTVFDMASVTKPMTATLLLQLIEEGQAHLGMKVADFLPEASESSVGPVTLRQLATHTSGLPAWKPLYKTSAASPLADILSTSLEAEPGTRYTYSDLGYILLGEILTRLTKTPLDVLANQRIFAPLDMTRTGFRPDPSLRSETAATANCPWREGFRLVGEVHDANCHGLSGISGHAGLFSTAPDLVRFARALFNTNPSPLLTRLAHRLAAESQIDAAIGGHSIGWFTPPNGMLPRGDLLSEQTFGHTGFTGTQLMFDPAHELTIILLTNRVYNPVDGTPFLRLRRLFANAVAAAISSE